MTKGQPENIMTRHAVLFDLDGTLADTALDLGGALNDLLRSKGQPEKPLAAAREHAAHGSAALLKFGAGITSEHPDFAAWQQQYLSAYENRFARDTVLFDGINDLLCELAEKGIAWGIVTNKHVRFTDKLVPQLNFVVPPAVVVSGDTCAHAKPHPEPLLYACGAIGVLPENCIYVGDAERDIQAGKNAGMKTVLALWGYIGSVDQPDTWGADAQAADVAQSAKLLWQWLAA